MDTLPVTLADANPGAGHNSEAALKELGALGRKAKEKYERALRTNRKSVSDAQVQACVIGRVVYEAKQLCGGNTKKFGIFLSQYKLDLGSLGSQTELNACSHLYQRVLLNKEFTLEGCPDSIPTNMMKWARRNHAHLFEQKPRAKKRDKNLIELILEAVRETPLDLGTKIFADMKGTPELAKFKRALSGRGE